MRPSLPTKLFPWSTAEGAAVDHREYTYSNAWAWEGQGTPRRAYVGIATLRYGGGPRPGHGGPWLLTEVPCFNLEGHADDVPTWPAPDGFEAVRYDPHHYDDQAASVVGWVPYVGKHDPATTGWWPAEVRDALADMSVAQRDMVSLPGVYELVVTDAGAGLYPHAETALDAFLVGTRQVPYDVIADRVARLYAYCGWDGIRWTGGPDGASCEVLVTDLRPERYEWALRERQRATTQ